MSMAIAMMRSASRSASSIRTMPRAGFFQPSSRACLISEAACSSPEFFERRVSISASAASSATPNACRAS